MRGRPDRLAFSRCSTTKLLLMRSARATNGAEWSRRGVPRASRYCRQLVWGGEGAAGGPRAGGGSWKGVEPWDPAVVGLEGSWKVVEPWDPTVVGLEGFWKVMEPWDPTMIGLEGSWKGVEP